MTGLITDPGFKKDNTEEYKLSIQVSLDGFYFSVVHPAENKLLAFEHYPVTISSEKFIGRRLKEWFEVREILQDRYSEISVCYHTPKFTFVPSAFYISHEKDKIASLVLGKQHGYVCVDNYFPNAEGNLVYAVPASLADSLPGHIPSESLQHPLFSLNKKFVKLANLNENNLLLYFTETSFYLMLYVKQTLKAVNSFSYYSQADVLFYNLSLLKQLKVNAASVNITLAGEISPGSEIHNHLQKYFKSTTLLTPEVNFNSKIFTEPLSRFIVLF